MDEPLLTYASRVLFWCGLQFSHKKHVSMVELFSEFYCWQFEECHFITGRKKIPNDVVKVPRDTISFPLSSFWYIWKTTALTKEILCVKWHHVSGLGRPQKWCYHLDCLGTNSQRSDLLNDVHTTYVGTYIYRNAL